MKKLSHFPFQIMEPEQRVKNPKKMFSFKAEHVLQIDRKNKTLSKKKAEVEKEKVRKQLEREKHRIKMNKMKEMENKKQQLEIPMKKKYNKCKSKQK